MREFDVVVYGATGFTGRLVAEYLLERGGPERIALGGRSMVKLQALRDDLGCDWDVVVADSGDRQALDALAARTVAVVTTVGPYTRYGINLVGACAQAGTHYADLAGEVNFMHDSIERFDAEARQTGARIVHASGFDSVPSDLGVMLLHEAADEPLRRTVMGLRWASGGFSGGTLASGVETQKAARADRRVAEVLADPYALAEPLGVDGPDLRWARYDEGLRSWTGPFVMSAINTRVVRRSNYLQDYAYGREFGYSEVTATGDGLLGRARALALAAGTGAGMAALSFGPSRAVAMRFLPDPGEGPSREAQAKGGFRLEFFGETESGRHVHAEVIGDRDPGYSGTARMIGEAGLGLGATEGPGGVLTPAVALGDDLVGRLRGAGFTLRAW